MAQTQPNLLQLAKQGNAKAIATLINRQLQPKGITAKAVFKDGCLQIMLESVQVPNQQALVAFIRKGITSLDTESIQKIKIYGRQIGEEFPAWSEEFELVGPLPEDHSRANQLQAEVYCSQRSSSALTNKISKPALNNSNKDLSNSNKDLNNSNNKSAKKRSFWNQTISPISVLVFLLCVIVWPVGIVYLLLKLLKLTKWSNNVKRSIVSTLLCIYLLMIVLAANKTPEVTPVASVQSSVVDNKAENTQKSYTSGTPAEKFLADYQYSARRIKDSDIKELLLTRVEKDQQLLVNNAKTVCNALSVGGSWEQIVAIQIHKIQEERLSSIGQQALTYDTKIINSLATVHFCPQFPGFR